MLPRCEFGETSAGTRSEAIGVKHRQGVRTGQEHGGHVFYVLRVRESVVSPKTGGFQAADSRAW